MTKSKFTPALFGLEDRVAVVTGGGGALGSEISEGLAGVGASVVVVDINAADARRVAARIGAKGGKAIAVAVDISQERDVAELFRRATEKFHTVDILVNGISAAIERRQPENVSLSDWQHMLRTNLTSYFLCSQAAARIMIGSGRGGSIINISSIGGINALGRGAMAYGVSKAGIAQLTRETSYAWAPHKIRVNAILPCQFTNKWWVAQQASAKSGPLIKRVLSAIPLGRLGEPHEIVGPVIFLASEASSMVTGVLLPVDGGNLAMNSGASREW
jgi:NAD(P)-dependent dehydrogenase (short-subunit alcohol dehydrogenase family)